MELDFGYNKKGNTILIKGSENKMVRKSNYSTAIKSADFLFLELKKLAQLKLNNPELSYKELKNKTIEENTFQVESMNRKKTFARALIKRIKVLDKYLLEQLTRGTLDTAKQIALYAILKTDKLFFDFMKEVYREKYLVRDPYLTEKDFSIFFQKKIEQSDRVADWSDYTYYKLEQTIVRVLFEADFINNKQERKILKPIMKEKIISHLKDRGDEEHLEVMLV